MGAAPRSGVGDSRAGPHRCPFEQHHLENRGTTRRPFFATLPEHELTAIKDAPAGTMSAVLVTGATHLPGHDNVSAPLREALFDDGRSKFPAGTGYTAYHLLTSDALDRPELITAGLTNRATGIDLGGCTVDEWLLRFGKDGFTAWIGDQGLRIAACRRAPKSDAPDQ